MQKSDGLTALFSGRFDRPHIGHIISIQRLAERFSNVHVVMLDYPEQKYAPAYRFDLLCEACKPLKNVEISSNKTHFGQITSEELQKYGYFIYVSGNHKCLSHVERLGYPVMFWERSYDFAASEEK